MVARASVLRAKGEELSPGRGNASLPPSAHESLTVSISEQPRSSCRIAGFVVWRHGIWLDGGKQRVPLISHELSNLLLDQAGAAVRVEL